MRDFLSTLQYVLLTFNMLEYNYGFRFAFSFTKDDLQLLND